MSTSFTYESDTGGTLYIEPCGQHEGCTMIDSGDSEYAALCHVNLAGLYELIRALQDRQDKLWAARREG